MKKVRFKYERGITLIALVITIIVLLILAGVSINLVVGENGILNKAQEARNKYEIEAIKEQIEVAKCFLELQDKKITATNIKEYLVENDIYEEGKIEILQKDLDYETIKIGKAEVDILVHKITLYFEKGETWSVDRRNLCSCVE